MTFQPLDDDLAAEAVEALKKHGSQNAAARALGIARSTFQNRISRAKDLGHLESSPPSEGSFFEQKPIPISASVAAERRIQRLTDEASDLRAKLKEAYRGTLAEEAVLEALGVMASAPVQPPDWPIRVLARNGEVTAEVPVTIWSDWHVGEVVEPDEVEGANAYSLEIAEKRIRRLVDSTLDICINHGPKNYPGMVINLLGDFVSGSLHPELAKTDEEGVIPASLRCRDLLIAALTRMADTFGKIYVPCAAGNHGRNTHKPEFKRYYQTNFDWLIYQLLKRHFAEKGDDRIQFDIRPSNQVLYRVYGQRYLAMHGDMMGVKGGDGIIGALGPIARGEVKTHGQSSSLGSDYDTLLIGHWHQSLWLPRVIVANSLKGFDEYAKLALRAPPSEPSQPLWFVHPSRGVTSRWDVRVEEPRAKEREWLRWSA